VGMSTCVTQQQMHRLIVSNGCGQIMLAGMLPWRRARAGKQLGCNTARVLCMCVHSQNSAAQALHLLCMSAA
jgi:hypothetical protein